jgi:hypothetical protein
VNKKIELFGKYLVIIGGILGIISFLWQAFDVVQNKRDIITSKLSCEIHNDPDIQVSLEIINLGQRPVFIKSAYIKAKSPELPPNIIVVSFVKNTTQVEPIQPGASAVYPVKINFDEANRDWLGENSNLVKTLNLLNGDISNLELFLFVESPAKTLLEENITNIIRKNLSAAEDLRLLSEKNEKSNFSFVTDCGQ